MRHGALALHFWGTIPLATFHFILHPAYCYFVFLGDGTRPTPGALHPTLHIPSVFGAPVGPYIPGPENTLFGRASRARESCGFKLSIQSTD